MSRVLVINYRGSGDYLGCVRSRTARKSEKKTGMFSSDSEMKKAQSKPSGEKGSASISILGAGFFMLIFIATAGAFYLFQVNDLATKGYEIRDLENRIQYLQKENKKMQIREVELTSMYSIERSTQDLGLTNSQNASYVEMKGVVAMK